MRIHGTAVAVSVLLCARTLLATPEPPAPSDRPAPTPVEAAAEVLKAVEAKDADGLATLARRDDPDPWLVADTLMHQEARAAAEAFANAAPRKDVEKLPEFLARWTATEADAAARKALALGDAGLREKRFADALGAFEGSPREAMTFLRARAAYGRGLALAGLGKPAEAADRFGVVSIDFLRLGWLARAAEALRECARLSAAMPNPAVALAPLKRLVQVETTRADPRAIARAWDALGALQGRLGRWEDAANTHTQALAVLKDRNERALMAEALNAIGWAEVHRGRTKEAQEAAERARAISELMGLAAVTVRSQEIQAMAYRAEGKLGMAEIAYGDAVETASTVADPALLARMRYHLGATRGDLGDPERALEALKPSLEAFESLEGAAGPSATLARARTAWSLALARKAAEARPSAERAVRDAEGGTRLLQGMAHWAEGVVREQEGKPEEAVKALTTAGAHLEAAREFDDSLRVVAAIAEVRRAQGKLPEARAAADSALEGARRFPAGLALPTALGASARVLLAQGQAQAALPLAVEARETFGRMRHANGVNAMGVLIGEIETAIPK